MTKANIIVQSDTLQEWQEQVRKDVTVVVIEHVETLKTFDVAGSIYRLLEAGDFAGVHTLVQAYHNIASTSEVVRHLDAETRSTMLSYHQPPYKPDMTRYFDWSHWGDSHWRLGDAFYSGDLSYAGANRMTPKLTAVLQRGMVVMSDEFTKDWPHGCYQRTGTHAGTDESKYRVTRDVQLLDVDWEGKLEESGYSYKTRRDRVTPKRSFKTSMDLLVGHAPNIVTLREPFGDVLEDQRVISRNLAAMQKDALFVSHKLTRARNSKTRQEWMQRMQAITDNWVRYTELLTGTFEVVTPLLPEERAAATAVKTVRVLLDG